MLQRFSTALVLLAIACATPGTTPAGTLDQIRKSGEIRIGHRADAPPLAFTDVDGQPAGYSVDRSLLSLADSGITAIDEIAGKSVAVISNTTSQGALKDYLAKNLIDAKVVSVASLERP